MSVSRRGFLAAAAVAGVPRMYGEPLNFPLGCQTYPLEREVRIDFDAVLRKLAGAGYRSIELCSPPSYRGGFGVLLDVKPAEIRRRIRDAGLICESCHFGRKELKETLDERIAWARELGLKQMVLSSFSMPRDAKMDDWLRAADELNGFAGKIHAAGMATGYHNHAFEFQKIDDALIYDRLMQAFDPQLVKMQFQVSVISLGYKASTYLTKYPGRFISLHLQDWSKSEKHVVPIGQGDVDWRELFQAAKIAGVRNYFVEMDFPLMAASVPFLHRLTV